jgi:hypothetical protein
MTIHVTSTSDRAREQPAGQQDPGDLCAPLGETGWTVWRWSAVRSAGLPADRLLQLCDRDLAAAANRLDDGCAASRETFAAEFAAATARLTAAMRSIASDGVFREAVTWQNPALARDCLDKVVRGERRNARGRYHELTVATYLQRYSVKNDTIGFFGPVAWARLGTAHPGIEVVPHVQLLSRRTTYLEHWAVAALADVLAEWPDVFPWLAPRREPSMSVEGATAHLPLRRPVRLSSGELAVLRRCDGRRTVRDLAGDPPDPGTIATLLRLRGHGVLRVDLRGPVVTWPERTLADRLAAIGDPAVRARAEAPLAELVAARDALQAAAGDARRVQQEAEALAATFSRLTGVAATRAAGAIYTGRTIAYEDTIRAVDVRVGQAVLDRLAAPLGLVLDSAAWLTDALALRFTSVAEELLVRDLATSGQDGMPLARLLMSFLPEMSVLEQADAPSAIVDAVVADLQDRWRRVLAVPGEAGDAGSGHLHFSSAELADRVAAEFPAGRPAWPDAEWHSPDVMVAARDAAALAAGDVDVVLGELHCAINTLRSRLFTESHPDVTDQRRLLESVDQGNRFVIVPRTDWAFTTPRMLWAPQTMLPTYTYLCLGAESIVAPPGAAAVSIMDLEVLASPAGPQVRHRRTGAVHALADVLGDLLSKLACNAFRPFAGGGRRPRISIDRLVVARASLTVPAAEAEWAGERDEARRFVRARRWRAATGLPERVFVRVPVERKPIALDFRSLPLVNMAAKAIRRSAEVPGGTVELAEMLPDLDALWLTDGAARLYTSELRLLARRPGA